MTTSLSGQRVAFVVANEGIEQAELAEPWKAVTEAGATAELIAPKTGHVQAFNHLDPADTFPVDVVTADADAASYDALTWVDEEVHVDSNIVSSRKPDDLPAFCDALIEKIAEEH